MYVTMTAPAKKLLLLVLKDFSNVHTVTSLANALGFSRVGAWKLLKRMASHGFVSLEPVGSGKTSASVVRLNWVGGVVDKALVLYLAEEAVRERRWRSCFTELEPVVDFLLLFGSVLHSPDDANDIDVLCVTKKGGFVKVQRIVDRIQRSQLKKVHLINFTDGELKTELKRLNPALVDAVRNGVVLFGQECFVDFMRGVSSHG